MLALILALVLFYFSHSFLASVQVKQWAAEHWKLVRWYRVFYSIVSVIMLGLVVWLLARTTYPLLFKVHFTIQLFALLVVLAGIGISLAAVLRFGALPFLGLRPESKGALVRTGMHGVIRHPIYTGIILAALGWAVLSPTLPVFVTILVSFIYLPIGIHLEERKLIAQFGEEYIRYRNEVPALLPGWKKKPLEKDDRTVPY